MRKKFQLVGLVIIISFFWGFFSSRVVMQADQPRRNEMATSEVDQVQPVFDSSEFTTFWRNVHEPVQDLSQEVSDDQEGNVRGGVWRLVGVVAIGAEEKAYLLTSGNELVTVREGEKLGGDYLITEINKKSVRFSSPEHGNLLLRLYEIGAELEL